MGKTLFLGDLEAQYKAWNKDIQEIAESVDLVVQLGNLTSLSDEARDQEEYGRNEAILRLWDSLALKTKTLALIGKNELAALNYPDQWTNKKSNTILRDSWLATSPSRKVALAINDRLVTHGGLTYGEWISIGKPDSALVAANRLQEKYENTLYQGESFFLTKKPNGSANPIWADPVLEVYPSWILAPEECPFDQIHGGESLNRTRGRQAFANDSTLVRYVDNVLYKKFGSVVTINNAIFV